MITYNWNKEKNLVLKRERNLSFEQIVLHIESGNLLDILQHPNKEKFAHQKILIIQIEDYIISVPFVENGDERFLKTIIPSRKLTRKIFKGFIMKNFNLDSEEIELLESLESDEWNSIDNLKNELEVHQNIAKSTLKKDKRVNLRMSSKDLEAIKTYAVEEGLPYQTLMSSVLHKFVTGRLIDRQAG